MTRTSSPKRTRQTERATHPERSAGPRGVALAPPDYGIEFVDHASASDGPIQRQPTEAGDGPVASVASRPSHTGLPDKLKAGVESLSGFDMSDVRVHFNSSKPARLQALAYTRGTHIHLAPGQARHLPHEAWHVAQQKQGRVQPSFQLKGEQFNDDQRLEHEADVMGKKVTSAGDAAPATQLRQSSGMPCNPRIQRVADPTIAPDVLNVISSGTANYGVYILEDGNETVAVKFSKEDTRRAVFADKVLRAAGIGNTNARVATQVEKDNIIENIRRVGRLYATGTHEQQEIAAKINAKIDSASKAVSVLIMEKAKGTDFFDIMADKSQSKAFLNSAEFHTQLGRLVAADALLGNSDRLAVQTGKTTPKGVLNAANFKVTAQSVINTIDNDTEIVGRALLEHLGTIDRPEAWASFLIGGGKEHFKPKGTSESATERETPDLESLFDKDKRKLMFNELVEEAKFHKVEAQFTVSFDEFDRSLCAGIAAALAGIRQHLDALVQAAEDIGGTDAGGGLIDPDALRYKATYLEERLGISAAEGERWQLMAQLPVSADEAKRRMVRRIDLRFGEAFRRQKQTTAELQEQVKALIARGEFAEVPIVELQANLAAKTVRKLNPRTGTHEAAKKLKGLARGREATAEQLKQREQELIETSDKEPGTRHRRIVKALFESKRVRFLLHMKALETGLDDLKRDAPPWKIAVLRSMKLGRTLKSEYEPVVNVWKNKLEHLKDKGDRGAELQRALDSLLKTAKDI
jgi:Domain of unknown function (DUF4157)